MFAPNFVMIHLVYFRTDTETWFPEVTEFGFDLWNQAKVTNLTALNKSFNIFKHKSCSSHLFIYKVLRLKEM